MSTTRKRPLPLFIAWMRRAAWMIRLSPWPLPLPRGDRCRRAPRRGRRRSGWRRTPRGRPRRAGSARRCGGSGRRCGTARILRVAARAAARTPSDLVRLRLQAAQLVEHLVQQHDQVARLQQAVEGFGVLDECACVGDVDVDGCHLGLQAYHTPRFIPICRLSSRSRCEPRQRRGEAISRFRRGRRVTRWGTGLLPRPSLRSVLVAMTAIRGRLGAGSAAVRLLAMTLVLHGSLGLGGLATTPVLHGSLVLGGLAMTARAPRLNEERCRASRLAPHRGDLCGVASRQVKYPSRGRRSSSGTVAPERVAAQPLVELAEVGAALEQPRLERLAVLQADRAQASRGTRSPAPSTSSSNRPMYHVRVASSSRTLDDAQAGGRPRPERSRRPRRRRPAPRSRCSVCSSGEPRGSGRLPGGACSKTTISASGVGSSPFRRAVPRMRSPTHGAVVARRRRRRAAASAVPNASPSDEPGVAPLGLEVAQEALGDDAARG